MQNIPTKSTGDSLTAAEWNQVPDEMENAITDTGQTLSGADLFQQSKAMSIYAAGGDFYTDSGAADAYVLSTIGSKRAPVAYFDGMQVAFKAGNANTGASTINVSGIGVKNVTSEDGTALSAGDIPASKRTTLRYDLAGDRFELVSSTDPVTLGQISGLLISNNAIDAAHDIDISTGECRDSANALLMTLSSVLVKQIDAAWAAGTNMGGLFSGTVAIDTWYHLHLIRKDSDGSIDAGFDTSVTAANIPGGYSSYRRIGSVLTDGSSNIIAFISRERSGGGVKFEWSSRQQDLNSTVGVAASAITVSSPLGIKSESELAVFIQKAAATAHVLISPPDTTDEAPSASVFDLFGNSTGAGVSVINKRVYTDTSSQIRARSDLAATGLIISTIGWTDDRR